MYGFITNASIEKMRNSARLVVGQVCNEQIYLYTVKTTDKKLLSNFFLILTLSFVLYFI